MLTAAVVVMKKKDLVLLQIDLRAFQWLKVAAAVREMPTRRCWRMTGDLACLHITKTHQWSHESFFPYLI
jgi:hypothetical protein